MRNKIMPVNTQFIKNKMKQNNLSVYELAERMNVNPTTIYKILKGQRGVTNLTIGKLVKALGMDKYHLYNLFIF